MTIVGINSCLPTQAEADAAFDAGYAFTTSYDALEGNGFTDRILAAIGLWEFHRHHWFARPQ